MDFLLTDQAILYTSEEYQEIYFFFSQKYEIKYDELFTICATIGFKNNRKSPVQGHGREFRSNYLNSSQRAAAYAIILADPELGRNIELFEDSEFRKKARQLLMKYAEGGMDILVEKVFGSRWDGYKLDPNYTEYDIDVLGYIYEDANQIPF